MRQGYQKSAHDMGYLLLQKVVRDELETLGPLRDDDSLQITSVSRILCSRRDVVPHLVSRGFLSAFL
jgi:hypothetical protein